MDRSRKTRGTLVMRPLRRKHQSEVVDDVVTGSERTLEASDEIDILSDEGSIDTVGKRKRYFRDCGCDGAPGGRCAESGCSAISCTKCHGHCAKCSQPTCLQHSYFENTKSSEQRRLCRRCRDGIARRQRLCSVARALLSPLVRFEEPDEKGG